MKPKWLAVIPAFALAAAPFQLQTAEASENEMILYSEVSPELQPILDVAPEHQPTLKQGSFGLEVELVQEKLNHFGFETAVDGLFGMETDEQIRNFQAAHDLAIDGIVGIDTWTALISEDRQSDFSASDAIGFAEKELNNEDLVFSSDGILHEGEDGKMFYSLKAASQSLIDNGGTGTVGFYDVYSNGDVIDSEPI